jgi:hypothetical protein
MAPTKRELKARRRTVLVNRIFTVSAMNEPSVPVLSRFARLGTLSAGFSYYNKQVEIHDSACSQPARGGHPGHGGRRTDRDPRNAHA